MTVCALARRCGRAFCDMLDKMLGRQQDLQPDYQPPATFSDEYWFGYEVRANGELLPAVQLLLQSLCHFLRNTQLQTAEIHWQLVGLDGNLQEVCVRSGCRHSDWQNWYQLTCIRFERLELQTAVERCRDLVAVLLCAGLVWLLAAAVTSSLAGEGWFGNHNLLLVFDSLATQGLSD